MTGILISVNLNLFTVPETNHQNTVTSDDVFGVPVL